MEIKNFKMDGVKQIAERFAKTNYVNRDEIINILSTSNVSFVAIGLTRAESTLLCELKCSYVQQSQRYCNMSEGGYRLPDILSDEHKKIAEELINQSFSLYDRMTELKEGVTKKPTVNDFKYGIPYEDGRYIFPLACLTNITISMSGDKLFDLFKMCITHKSLTKEFYNALLERIDRRISTKIQACINYEHYGPSSGETYFYKIFDEIPEGGVYRIYADDSIKNIAIGALTSTNSGEPTDVYNDEDAMSLVNRVAFGYGHVGILEQSRNTYGFSCSLSAYHQVIRHRIATLYRESIGSLLYNRNSSFYVPKTILDSKFTSEYCDLVYRYFDFIKNIRNDYPHDAIFPLLLNCSRVKFISSSNARNDMYIFRERLCNRAQEEIRELYTKKYEDLMKVMPDVYKHAGPPCVNGHVKKER